MKKGLKIGEGHNSIVFEDEDNKHRVIKVTKNIQEWEREVNILSFFKEQGFQNNYFPKIHSAEQEGDDFYIMMDKIYGVNGKEYLKGCNDYQKNIFGRNILKASLEVHNDLKYLERKWVNLIDSKDTLLDHILEDKLSLVRETLTNKEELEKIGKVAQILKTEIQNEEIMFMHNDGNFGNYVVSPQEASITGIVDIGTFGRTTLSLSLYQATEDIQVLQGVFDYAKLENIEINKKVLFAAGVIHWAWAEPYLKKMQLSIDSHVRENYRYCSEYFFKEK